MLDTIIKNGLIVDGTGEQSFFGDIGIKNGIIYEIGKISSQAKKIYDEKRLSFLNESRVLDTTKMEKMFPGCIKYTKLTEGIKASL